MLSFFFQMLKDQKKKKMLWEQTLSNTAGRMAFLGEQFGESL